MNTLFYLNTQLEKEMEEKKQKYKIRYSVIKKLREVICINEIFVIKRCSYFIILNILLYYSGTAKMKYLNANFKRSPCFFNGLWERIKIRLNYIHFFIINFLFFDEFDKKKVYKVFFI